MIEKNIRLQPHHSRDLLVGRRSDGRRPGYQPPGHRDAPSRSSDRGGHAQHATANVTSRPAPAPSRPAPSPHRDPAPVNVVTTAKAPPSILSRPDPVVTTAVAPPSILSRPTPPVVPTIHHHTDTIEDVIQQEVLDKIREEEKEKFKDDWEFEDTKVKAPTTLIPKYVKDVKIGVPHLEDPITKKQRHYYGDIGSKTTYGFGPKGDKTYSEVVEQDMKQYRGSGILGTLGKGLLTLGTAGAGAGLFGKDIATLAKLANYKKNYDRLQKSTLGQKLNLKKLDFSNLTSTIDKAKTAKFRDEQTTLGKEDIEAWERKQDWSGVKSPKGGDGANIPQAVTGEEGLLTEGAKTLGLTEEQREQYRGQYKILKTTLDQGSYINAQGQTIQLNEQQMDQLQNYIDKLNEILGTVLHTDPMPTGAAHGGRIDGPLVGGSRYI